MDIHLEGLFFPKSSHYGLKSTRVSQFHHTLPILKILNPVGVLLVSIYYGPGFYPGLLILNPSGVLVTDSRDLPVQINISSPQCSQGCHNSLQICPHVFRHS